MTVSTEKMIWPYKKGETEEFRVFSVNDIIYDQYLNDEVNNRPSSGSVIMMDPERPKSKALT